MPRPKLESCTRILVVEGYDDLLAYAEILEHVSNYDEKVFIKDMGGRSNIVTKLETFLSPALLAPGQKAAIGVIVDADKDGAGISRSLEVEAHEDHGTVGEGRRMDRRPAAYRALRRLRRGRDGRDRDPGMGGLVAGSCEQRGEGLRRWFPRLHEGRWARGT
ncbi:MAG: DUF3226 domain-containing protein [Ottowia sp.]